MQRALLYALIAGSFLMLGGSPLWTRPILLAIAAAGLAVAPGRTLRFPRENRLIDAALLTILAAMGVQLIPLPATAADALSPHSAGVLANLHYALGDTPQRWRPLTLDSTATLYAMSVVAIGIAAFWIARASFAAGHTRQFCRVIALGSGIAAAVALVQKFSTPTLLLGAIAPAARNANPFGPFVNRNHFAAWLLMCAAIAVGYLIAHLHIHPEYHRRFREAFKYFLTSGALLTGIAATLTVMTMLFTMSRSAAAGLGAAALGGAWLGRPRIRIERTAIPSVLAATGVMLLVAVAFIDFGGWSARLQESFRDPAEGLGRITIWRQSLPIARDFLVTGTGAGTFELAMSQYQQSRVWIGAMSGWVHINNAHSHYLQVAAEGGLLLIVPSLIAICATAILGFRRVRHDAGEMMWTRVGAMAGLIGIAVQSIWEVSLTVPANAVMCGVLAALAVYRRETTNPPAPRH